MHKSQIFFYLIASFLGGVFVTSLFPISLSVVLFLTLAGISLFVISAKNKYFILSGFILLSFAVGIARFDQVSSYRSGLENMAGRNIVVNGYINNEPESDGNKMKFILRTDEGDNILVTTGAYPERQFGDLLRLEGKIQLPKNFDNFDYITYLKKEGVRTIMSYPGISGSEFNPGLSDKYKIHVYRKIFEIKQSFEASIDNSLPEPNASFVNGILLGSRQNIPKDLQNDFNKTSTTHVLAISGYNITILSEFLLLGLVWLFRRRTAFWITVLMIILFTILTGASASVVRASVMGLILLSANAYGRLYDQKNSIILAGGLMVWFNPYVLVFDVGFQLSFAAVLGLIYIYPQLESKLNKVPDIGGLKELVLMTVSAQIVVLPLLIYYFNQFSAVALPANILILPFVPAAMLAGFVTGLAGLLSRSAGQIFGYVAWAITTYQLNIVEYLATF